jgi:hypothetical protein
MESLLISLVSIALTVIATITITMTVLTSAVTMTDSWSKMEQSVEEIRRTSIAITPPADYYGGNITLAVANDGQTNLADFSSWDIIAEYPNGDAQYLTYTTNATPAANQWVLQGIYMSGNTTAPEVFDLNILNPCETAMLKLNLTPQIGSQNYGRITVSTPNGVSSQTIVYRH